MFQENVNLKIISASSLSEENVAKMRLDELSDPAVTDMHRVTMFVLCNMHHENLKHNSIAAAKRLLLARVR